MRTLDKTLHIMTGKNVPRRYILSVIMKSACGGGRVVLNSLENGKRLGGFMISDTEFRHLWHLILAVF